MGQARIRMLRSEPNGCRICGRALTAHQVRSGGICGEWRCREAQLSAAAEEERLRAARCVRRRGPDRGEDWESAPIVIVPWRRSELRPLSDGRRREFLGYIETLLSAVREERTGPATPCPDAAPPAVDTDGATPVVAPVAPAAGPGPRAALVPDADAAAPPDPVLAQICAACRGACCHAGGTHAFLDAERIAALVDRMGGVNPVREAYRRHLPARSVLGSCVFHTEQGCNLPREMRGELCNRYECRGLEGAGAVRAQGGVVVHVVRREEQEIYDSAFAGEGWLEVARRSGRRSVRPT